MGTIEFVGNYLEIYEKSDYAKKKQASNTPDFWEWEQKILGMPNLRVSEGMKGLEQEKEFYENKISELSMMIGAGEEENVVEEAKSFGEFLN